MELNSSLEIHFPTSDTIRSIRYLGSQLVEAPQYIKMTDETQPLLQNAEVIPPTFVTKNKLYAIIGSLWVAVFLGAMDGTIVATLQTSIGDYFHQSHRASLIGSSYLLSVCCFTPLYGRLADILGRKGAMLLALFLFGIGTLLCGVASSLETLIIARAIAGMGGGGVMTVSSITATDLIPLRDRGLIQGMTNILFGLGAGMGAPIGGLINDTVGWRVAFLFQIPILAVATILVVINLPTRTQSTPPSGQSQSLSQKLRRIDYLGSLTLVLFIGSLLVGVTIKTTEDIPWSDPKVYGLLVGSLVAGIAFVWTEHKWSAEPVMPLGLLTQRNPLSVAFVNFFSTIAIFSMLYNVPLYFMAVRLQTSTDAGLHLLPNSLSAAIGSLGAGWMMRHTGKYYRLTVVNSIVLVIANVLVATWDQKRTSPLRFWIDLIPNGFSYGAILTTTLIAIIVSVGREDVAVATGITYLFRTPGQVLGVSLSGALIQGILVTKLREKITGPDAAEIIDSIRHRISVIPTLPPHLRDAAVESYTIALRTVFIAQVVLSFLALLCALPIEERPLPGSHAEHEERHRRRSEQNGEPI